MDSTQKVEIKTRELKSELLLKFTDRGEDVIDKYKRYEYIEIQLGFKDGAYSRIDRCYRATCRTEDRTYPCSKCEEIISVRYACGALCDALSIST